MAGAGSRFAKAGYALPKPLIDVAGSPMIEWVVNNLRPSGPCRFVFLAQRSHIEEYELSERLSALAENVVVVPIDGMTEGAAQTLLFARDVISHEDPVLIANSDQYVDADIDDFLAEATQHDGLIMTMTADDPKWSFVTLNEQHQVLSVVEKVVVSNEATVGIYYFARWGDFVSGADAMISDGETSAGEYYVAPVYNRLIAHEQNIGIFNIGSERDGMYGLGIPEDLEWFLTNRVANS